MKILAFDTATNACTVALKVDEKIFASHKIAPRLHASLLLPMIQALLIDAKIKLSDLNAIAFGCGPGSFMGIRLATGMAQGLAFGLQIPVIPISTLQILAQTFFEKTGAKKIIAGWDARLHEIYWGFYVCDKNNVMQSQHEDALCTLDQLDKKSFAELGCAFAGNIFSDETYPEAKAMLTIANQKYLQKEFVSPENAHPHYVRHVAYTHK
ncbi:MAG TPA: tRNA (adenosine(37)-N6)-threonylcarbamoyltransferase complex dimerization subunit type 1 TsaB [Coxiellaceae bacterium]|nr:MAG: tRNA (adenosine(37)-N6)-threonylcarbamoyltransferase complex dimerization subunit type 1 TsaB [Gammaproteobacteria bacterium RIFCSPHIGHO2_12_FULL_36_30]HLB57153.1 tRNA (adenosine(37)-N6)-threonylcarbamoyltransferase complex dimerization subunit type 1 TsaB [Coxiellaceae bacterium]